MNKTLSVILIVVACLVALSGTYWYIEMRPKTTQSASAESQMAESTPPVEKPAVQAPVQTPTQKQTIPVTAKTSTPTASQPKAATAPVAAPVAIEKVTIEEPKAPPAPLPPPTDPLVASGLLKLPGSDAPSIKIPLAPVSQAQNFVPTPTIAEPVVAPERIAEENIPAEEPKPEQTAPPEDTAEKIILTPSAPQTPVVPTSRVEFDPQPLSWATSASVSFVDYQWPGTVRGFDIQADILRRSEGLFSFGGAIEYSNVGTAQEMSVLAKVQWTFNQDKTLSFPVSLSLGPTFQFKPTSEFGLLAKLQAGFSYSLTERLRFFYQAGMQLQYLITSPALSFSLEPMRVGFSISF